MPKYISDRDLFPIETIIAQRHVWYHNFLAVSQSLYMLVLYVTKADFITDMSILWERL